MKRRRRSADGTGDTVGIRSLVILSQDVHRIFGGVVPEIASRVHLTTLVPVVRRALAEAGCTANELEAIAVTNAPGLVGALLVGTSVSASRARLRPRDPVHRRAPHGGASLRRRFWNIRRLFRPFHPRSSYPAATHAPPRRRGLGAVPVARPDA